MHDRMPVVLTPRDMVRWLGNQPLGESELKELCELHFREQR